MKKTEKQLLMELCRESYRPNRCENLHTERIRRSNDFHFLLQDAMNNNNRAFLITKISIPKNCHHENLKAINDCFSLFMQIYHRLHIRDSRK